MFNSENTRVFNRCHDLFRYCNKTGKLFWKKSIGAAKIGSEAGSISRGYVLVRLDGVLYKRSRLVWLMNTGAFPKYFIDHIDHDRSNDKMSNLRDVSRSENMKNFSLGSRNRSGVLGVTFNRQVNKWEARIQNKRIGFYSEFDQAVIMRKSAEKNLGFHKNHGVKS